MANADIRFTSPPASEVLQGIFFEPHSRFTSPMQGALWFESFRQDFPIPEEKPPIKEVTEQFGVDVLRKAGAIQFRISDKPDAPRIWAKSTEGDRILQLQSNALITNWLKKKDSSPYIHFADRKKDFADRLNALQLFFDREDFGQIQPTSCLMTYVNQIEVERLEEVPNIAASLFKFAAQRIDESWLPPADQFSLAISYPMKDRMGRLHVSASPAFQERSENEKQPLLRFELTARGQPKNRTIEGALAWLDLGHDWIVRGFVDATKSPWHEKWKMQ